MLPKKLLKSQERLHIFLWILCPWTMAFKVRSDVERPIEVLR